MASLQLVRVEAAAPGVGGGGGAPAADVLLAARDHCGLAAFAGTADGLLHLLPLPAAAHASTAPNRQQAAHSFVDSFAVTLIWPGQPGAERLSEPWAALCPLPRSDGLLLAQRGSGRLLFCQHPAALELGSAADLFLFGCHDSPVTSIAVSPCGSLALSTDAGCRLKLWSLADGSQLAVAEWPPPPPPPPPQQQQQQPGTSPSSSISPTANTSCCFLQTEGLAVTACLGSTCSGSGSAVAVWSFAGGCLRQLGELDAGEGRQVTALAAAGCLVAVGCSDGSTLLWRYQDGEFMQQAMLAAGWGGGGAAAAQAAAPAPAPISLLSFSSAAATRLAAAAGTAVAVWSSEGQHMSQHALPVAPVALLWGGCSGGELLALLPDGGMQLLGGAEGQPGLAASAGSIRWLQQQHLQHKQQQQQQQEPPSPAKPRKAVRFADSMPSTAVHVGAAALQGQRPYSSLPPPTAAPWLNPSAGGLQRSSSSSSSSSSGSGAAAAVCAAPLPRLPAHPLLRHAASTRCSRSRSRSSSPAKDRPAPVPASAVAGAHTSGAQSAPLYPILDLRALQGLGGAAAADEGGSSSIDADEQQLGSGSWQWAEHQSCPAVVVGEPPAAGQAAGVGRSGGKQDQERMPTCADTSGCAAEAARQRQLPAPVPRVSRQQCDACKVLTAAAAGRQELGGSGDSGDGGNGGSRPASPAKAALLAQLAQLTQESQEAGLPAASAAAGADGGAGSGSSAGGAAACEASGGAAGACASTSTSTSSKGGSRRTSPLKLGVACTRQAQQQLGEEQPPEVKAFAVAELDVSLAHAEARRQRYARLTRRCVFAGPPLPSPAPLAPQQLQQSAPIDCQQAAVAAAAQPEEQAAAAKAQAEAGAAAAVGSSGSSSAAALTDPPAWLLPAAGDGAGGFAVASDVELSDEDEEGEALVGAWKCGAGVSSSSPTSSSVSALQEVAGRLQQLDGRLAGLAQRAQRHARRSAQQEEQQLQTAPPPAAGAQLPLRPPAQPQPQPASALAAPAPNSSLLLLRRQRLLKQQLAAAAAQTAALNEEELAAARRRAATAATTLPPSARILSALPPPPVPLLS